MARFCRDVPGFEIQEAEDSSNAYLEKTERCFCMIRGTVVSKKTPITKEGLRNGF